LKRSRRASGLERRKPIAQASHSQPRSVTCFRIPGVRTPQYALLRELPRGLSARQRIYRCLSGGHIEPFADVEFLSAVATLERQGRLTRLYGGLPPYMAFAAPSGFLGRQLAHDRQPRGRTAAAGTPGDALPGRCGRAGKPHPPARVRRVLRQAGFVARVRCAAPTTVTTPGSTATRHATQAFAGVNWTFGVGPELVAGLRYTRTDSHQRIGGARLEAVFPFDTAAKALGFDRLRLRYIGGSRSGMYELGGGYSFSGQGALASAALQAEHVHVGTDLIFAGMTWLPYVGFETLSKPKRAEAGDGSSVTTCPIGYALRDVSTITTLDVNPENQVNGQTCFRAGGRG